MDLFSLARSFNEMIEEKYNHNNIIIFYKKNKYIEINLLHISYLYDLYVFMYRKTM